MVEPHILDLDIAPGDCRRDHQRGRFNPIGNDAVRHPLQTVDTFDPQKGCSQPRDLGTHSNQATAEIDHFRFTGRRFDRRHPLCERGRRHDVAGPRDGAAERPSQIDRRTPQPRGLGMDVTALDREIGPQSRQPLQVQVNRAIANVAASRQRNTGPAATGQQRTEDADRRPHPSDEFVVGNAGLVIDHFEFEGSGVGIRAFQPLDPHPQRPQQMGERLHIDQFGHALQPGHAIGQEGTGHDRKSGILRPAGPQSPAQRPPACDHQHVHPWTPPTADAPVRLKFCISTTNVIADSSGPVNANPRRCPFRGSAGEPTLSGVGGKRC